MCGSCDDSMYITCNAIINAVIVLVLISNDLGDHTNIYNLLVYQQKLYLRNIIFVTSG